jgi:hypothetical protein
MEKNEVHLKHVNTLPERKINYLSWASWSEQNPFIDLNNHLKYNTNTNVATKEKGTMLTRSSGLGQFNQRVNEKFVRLHPRLLEGSYETNEGMWNKIQTTPKWS